MHSFLTRASSALPFGSNVAVCCTRGVVRLPVSLHVSLAGAYSCVCPPATSTMPLGSNVAVCSVSPVVRPPVALHVPLAVADKSALLGTLRPSTPAGTAHLPVG